jgi:hypothetical protein
MWPRFWLLKAPASCGALSPSPVEKSELHLLTGEADFGYYIKENEREYCLPEFSKILSPASLCFVPPALFPGLAFPPAALFRPGPSSSSFSSVFLQGSVSDPGPGLVAFFLATFSEKPSLLT